MTKQTIKKLGRIRVHEFLVMRSILLDFKSFLIRFCGKHEKFETSQLKLNSNDIDKLLKSLVLEGFIVTSFVFF